MTDLLLIVLSAGSLAISVLVVRLLEAQRLRSELVALDLRFPRNLPAEDLQRFVAGLSGLLRPWWVRPFTTPFVALETVSTPGGISHRLLVPESLRHRVEDVLQAHLPSVRYQRLDTFAPAAPTAAAEYRMNTSDRALRVDAPSLSRALLTGMQPLRRDEQVTIQWVLAPASPVSPARRRSLADATSAGLTGTDATREDGEAVAALKAKQSSALMLAIARIGVTAASPERARALLGRAESAWHATRAPGVHMRRRALPSDVVARRTGRVTVPLLAWPMVCNAEELAGLIGVPVEADQIPGLLLGGCRQLAASPLLPRKGIVLGESTFPGDERPIALDTTAQLRHAHLMGPTGVGKSTLLLNSIVQNIAAGAGVTVLDPKGDLIADVLERIPPDRVGDIIVLDAADDAAPVGLNPLHGAASVMGNGEVVVENLVGLMHNLWSFSWGPRTDDIIRAALLTLVRKPGMSLVEVPALLLQDSFRQRLVGSIDDPVGLESFWGWYHGLSDAERATVVAAPLNKLRAFTMRPRIRRIIGQSNPGLDMPSVLADGKILLVNLASGLLGEDAANLLGALVVAELWHATTARAGISANQRRLHVAYLDEFQHFLHLPTPIATVLAEARSLGLGMVLAHQHLHQLPTDIREGVLANARSRVIFQAGASDARALARELGSSLTPEDLQGLGAYEVVASVFASGQVTPPCTARTLPAPPPCSDPDAIRQESRARYGRPVADIDVEIAARTASGRTAPVGARNRRRPPRQGSGGQR